MLVKTVYRLKGEFVFDVHTEDTMALGSTSFYAEPDYEGYTFIDLTSGRVDLLRYSFL